MNDLLATLVEEMIPEYLLFSSISSVVKAIKFKLEDESEKFQSVINDYLG